MRAILRAALLAATAIGFTGTGALAQGDDVYEFGPKGPPAASPIPENNPADVAKQLGLVEGATPISQMPGWHKPRKIVVFVDNNTNRLAWFQKAAPGVTLVPVHNRVQLVKAAPGADAIIGNNCSKAAIAAAGPQLEYVHDYHAGVEGCVSVPPDGLKNGGIILTNTQRVLGSSVAYHAIALMVTLSRGLDLFAEMTRAGHVDNNAIPPGRLWELDGRTLLVAGLGGIGGEMARYAHALGMHVIATNRSIPQNVPDYIEHVGFPGELGDMIGKADVVMSALPLTPETTNLFNADMFARMKKGALFINVTRGKEVVTADLITALKSGQLGGAGLDATEPESATLPPTDPLWSAPNLILTPHMASQAVDAETGLGGQLTWDVARENLRRFVNGDRLYSVVNVARGY